MAAALLEGPSLKLVTALDERSAAFFALGWGRASGQPAAVITTSGTAVANLLPAVVEADFGGIPLLLITADRPAQLKGCGANQTVNQEAFLAANVRWLAQVPADGRPEGLAIGVQGLRQSHIEMDRPRRMISAAPAGPQGLACQGKSGIGGQAG